MIVDAKTGRLRCFEYPPEDLPVLPEIAYVPALWTRPLMLSLAEAYAATRAVARSAR